MYVHVCRFVLRLTCPFGCFVLRFLAMLSVSMYGARVCVDGVRV